MAQRMKDGFYSKKSALGVPNALILLMLIFFFVPFAGRGARIAALAGDRCAREAVARQPDGRQGRGHLADASSGPAGDQRWLNRVRLGVAARPCHRALRFAPGSMPWRRPEIWPERATRTSRTGPVDRRRRTVVVACACGRARAAATAHDTHHRRANDEGYPDPAGPTPSCCWPLPAGPHRFTISPYRRRLLCW